VISGSRRRGAMSKRWGHLSLVAEFPNREPVILLGIAEEAPASKPARKNAHATA
jgi:hypothetical protein